MRLRQISRITTNGNLQGVYIMELRKVDSENIWKIVKLSVFDEQKGFVATNTESILEAYVTALV